MNGACQEKLTDRLLGIKHNKNTSFGEYVSMDIKNVFQISLGHWVSERSNK
jgi:hypothetical protein